MDKYDVFISYSRKDYIDDNQNVIPNNVVSTIKDTLTQEGITYWFDEEGIYSGQNFIEKIVTNIEASKVFVYLSTANANNSKWTCKEIASADEFGKHIIPVRIDRTPYNKKVLFRIADLDYIEYYTNPEKGLKDLVNAIKTYLSQLEEEARRREEEERRKREDEKKRKEEEEAKKQEEEKRRNEEQKRIFNEIELACTKLNNEEQKLDLDRDTLLVNAERIVDPKSKEQLKSFISSSSPIRQKLSNEIEQLKDRLGQLESELASLRIEKERLKSELEQAQNNGDDKHDKQNKELVAKLKKELAAAEKESDRHRKECEKLNDKVTDLQKQLEGQALPVYSKKTGNKVHIIYGVVILALLGIGIWQVLHWYNESDYSESDSNYYSSAFFEAEDALKSIADGNMFVVTDINVHDSADLYDGKIYSSTATYLVPEVYTYAFYGDEFKIDIKFFDRFGDLIAGSSSPIGYSYSTMMYLCQGRSVNYVGSFGFSESGYWPAGKYRVEVWYDKELLKAKEFTIY